MAYSPPVPQTAVEYGERYADKDFPIQEYANVDVLLRRLLRFYNQVGILMEKRLVDEDFVYALIGAGLDSSWPAVSVAVQYYQRYHGGASGHELAEPRPIHAYVKSLHDGYLNWARTTGKTLLDMQDHGLT